MTSLFLVMMTPLIIVLPLYTLSNKIKVFMTELLIGFQIVHLLYSIYLVFIVWKNGTLIENIGGYKPPIGIQLEGDYESIIFVALTSFIYLIVLLFGLNKKYVNRRFLLFLMTLETLIIGIYLSDDLFNLFILIEVATIVVSTLIMYKKGKRFTYDAILYLLTNLFVMSFFLFGLGYIYKIFGTVDLNLIEQSMFYIEDKSQLVIPFGFIMLAISLKIAMFPMFFWLPKAYATPSTPSVVSAVLSGVFTKSSIYLFIKITGTFSYHFDVSDFFLVIGIVTSITGLMLAYIQIDFRKILAYSSINHMGLIIIGLSLGTQNAYYGAFYHILNHGLFKPLLFLSASAIVHGYGIKYVTQVSGLYKTDKLLACLTFIGVLSVTGFPLLNGYFSKNLIYSNASSPIINTFLTLIQFGSILYFVKYSQIFFGEKISSYKKPTKIQYVALSLLAILCLGFGLTQYGMINLIYSQNLVYDTSKYLSSLLEYISFVLIAVFIHKWLDSKIIKIARFVRKYELSFNSIASHIVLYGTVFFIYLITQL